MINKLIADSLPFMPKKLIWIFSKRYIAGETIDECMKVSHDLNRQGIDVTIDLLGEFISTIEQAEENRNKYIDIIERATAEKIVGNFSIKPSMFGLLIDKNICYSNIEAIVLKAVEKKSFIRIDMEDSRCVDSEIDIYLKLHQKYPANVGLVIQAYLRRTMNDLTNFGNRNQLNFRLCKGIYIEPKHIAYKDREEIREHYLADLKYMLEHNMYVGIATHDKYLVDSAIQYIKENNIDKSKFEFQMLYGVTPELRKSIAKHGYKIRVYVPFGKDWFNYSTRRLKENPKIASHIIKALFVRG